jgi:glutamate synthase domain-containing protein 3
VCESSNPRTRQIDLDQILRVPATSSTQPIRQEQPRNDPPVKDVFIDRLAEDAAEAWDKGKRLDLSYHITNSNRTVGARLAYEVSCRHGADGLPEGTLEIKFDGSAGQSFGAFLTKGIRLNLEGEANDYVGKGMGGGEIVVVPPKSASFEPHKNIIMGNTVLYGATGGNLFAAGRAGERFAVRNSGATAVIEGAGDHCCEYMTGGVVVVLGPVGRNFAAGMSAGTAYVLDESGEFPGKVNPELVDIERIWKDGCCHRPDDEERLRALIEEHVAVTGSARGQDILNRWEEFMPMFWQVVPDPPTVQTHTPGFAP